MHLSQHAKFAPLGPWLCARGAFSSPSLRSGALTWPVLLTHSQRLTCRAQRSAWPTFPWRPFCWAAMLLSRRGEQRGRSCLRLHCCPGALNHCHLLGDTFQCVCVCVQVCRRRPTHMRAHMHSHKEACWGWIWSALWGLQVDAGQHLGRTPPVSSVWLTLCTTAHTLWPLPPTSLPSILQIHLYFFTNVARCL